MPWISLPAELALPHLLDLQGVSVPLRDRLAQVLARLAQDDPDAALASLESCYGIAKRGFDRYGQALALVLEAEVCRRLALWEDGLGKIRHALRRLELQVAPIGRYNEALTVYLEGVIHCTLQSREQTVQTFSYAGYLLTESEHTWEREGHVGRVADCRNVVRWMAQLLEIQETLRPHSSATVLPVYEIVNRAWIRTDALAVRAAPIVVPTEVLLPYLPPATETARHVAVEAGLPVLTEARARTGPPDEEKPFVLPLHSAMLPFPYLDPSLSYVAVRAPSDASLLGQGKKGDLLIVEVTGTSVAVGGPPLTSDVPFVRRGDGRIEIGFATQDVPEVTWPAGGGFVGIPRVVIREGDQR